MLLSRVADSIYWGARYLERAEDTARVVRSYTDLIVDLPTSVTSSWEPLLAIVGGRTAFDEAYSQPVESAIVRFLVADRANSGSVASSIDQARENLRTTREVLPREAWQAVNDLYLYSGANALGAVDRRGRAPFLNRVVGESQQLEGVISSAMSRDEAYDMWVIGKMIERADMTTRVVGVRAASLLAVAQTGNDAVEVYDDVQWMGVLRSVSALQMYQRAVHGPIDGVEVVRFLLHDPKFPRSVASCVARVRGALERLPRADHTVPAVEALEAVLAALPNPADDGAALDAAMDDVQVGLAAVHDAVAASFVRSMR